MLKLAIRGTTLQYSARKKKAKKNLMQVTERKIVQIQRTQKNLPTSLLESTEAQIYKLKQDLNALLSEQAMGSVIRSRSNWEFAADRPSRYFLNLEKRNYCAKTIYRLELDSGTTVSDQTKIRAVMKEYYENLYTSRGSIDYDYIKDLEAPKITEELKKELDSPLTLVEMSRAIKSMANQKCPGTDGLPVDFYKIFYAKLKNTLFEVYTEVVEDGVFHLSARKRYYFIASKSWF